SNKPLKNSTNKATSTPPHSTTTCSCNSEERPRAREPRMRLVHFNVSQIRVAATCPRLHWFDARENATRPPAAPLHVSRIWRNSETGPGGGALFHRAVERFNGIAAKAPEITAALDSAPSWESLQQQLLQYFNTHCLHLDAFAEKPVEMRVAFVTALQG